MNFLLTPLSFKPFDSLFKCNCTKNKLCKNRENSTFPSEKNVLVELHKCEKIVETVFFCVLKTRYEINGVEGNGYCKFCIKILYGKQGHFSMYVHNDNATKWFVIMGVNYSPSALLCFIHIWFLSTL